MNDTTTGTKTLTVEVPIMDGVPKALTDLYVGGFPFDDTAAQQWKLGAAPITNNNGDTEHLLVLHQERMDLFRLVGNNGKYQEVVCYEPGGGGALTLPFELVRTEGVVTDILVTFFTEQRRLIQPQGETLSVSGGFQNPDATSEETARAEHAEELSVEAPEKIGEVSDSRSVANRSCDVAFDVMEGLKVYAYEMSPEKRAELESNGAQILSFIEGRRSRDQIVKGALFDLITWVTENYTTAL